jgi:hypothetical protein
MPTASGILFLAAMAATAISAFCVGWLASEVPLAFRRRRRPR